MRLLQGWMIDGKQPTAVAKIQRQYPSAGISEVWPMLHNYQHSVLNVGLRVQCD
jgi:hypothetical protein